MSQFSRPHARPLSLSLSVSLPLSLSSREGEEETTLATTPVGLVTEAEEALEGGKGAVGETLADPLLWKRLKSGEHLTSLTSDLFG